MTISRDFLKEFKERCKRVDNGEPRQVGRREITPETFNHYQVVKRTGDDEKAIAFGLTLRDAEILVKTMRSKLNLLPTKEDGSPVFELEIYKVTIAGKERHQEKPRPRFDPDTRWID